MNAYVGIAWYVPETYAACRHLMADKAELPVTYPEWLAQAKAQLELAARQGSKVVKAHIDPVSFPDFCLLRGMPMDRKARERYAAMKVREFAAMMGLPHAPHVRASIAA